ncbi:DUF2628 domain-containing protein [Bacillus sp. V3B]|uniref:DUF2628 domain-containing protein n=1 Tax=Bacillus sp. V3B TaxID=2804915 RepID=UPI002108F446|nr:DUF2628 domain-containing protein [Bacillus sp. V3B]MCQ6274724.1 DUF2628 domain-containing protein [Bacillus sp. V3B]
MFCSYCGTKLNSQAGFCQNCGKEVLGKNDTEPNQEEQSKTAIPNQLDGALEVSLEKTNGPAKVDEQLLRTFIGEKKEDYYVTKWAKGDRSWNWAAFFLTFFWSGYRKMFKPIIWAIVIFLIIDLVVLLFGIDDTMVNSAIGIGMAMSFGLSGNYFYRQHAIKTIANIMDKHPHNEAAVRNEIRLQGGASWKGALGSVGLWIVYIAAVFVMITFVPPLNQPSGETNIPSSIPVSERIEKTDKDIENEIIDLIHKNMQALENEDLEEYMSMLSKEDTTLYYQTEEMLTNLFTHYDVTYEISDIEFLTISEDRVKVRLTQTSKLVEGEEYRDNESILTHTIKKEDSDWKFLASEAESVHYLDKETDQTTDLLSEGRLDDDPIESQTSDDSSPTSTSYEEAERISQQSCIQCHGQNFEGSAAAPPLSDIGSKYSQSEIEEIVLNGKGIMPGGLISEEEAEVIAEYLSSLK